MRRWALPLAIVLLVAILPPASGAGDGVASGWRETLVIDSATAGPAKAFEAFDTPGIQLYDVNKDGQLEIIANNDNNRVYVLDARTGKVLSELETFHYNNSKWPVRELNPIAVGDVYGDGVPCLVVPNSAGWLTTFCYNAAASTATKLAWDKKWQVRVDAKLYEPNFKAEHPWLYHPNGTLKDTNSTSMDGPAYLADVDGDGKKEIFVQTDGDPGQFAFNHDGTYRWSKSFWDGNSGPKVLDIDKDGVKEAVFASDGGAVAAYNAKTGGIEWSFDTTKNGAMPGSIPVAPLVADLHGDGRYEIIFGARNVTPTQSDPDWINQSHARYFALDSKGQLLWSVSYDWMNPLQYNDPAPADVNGDGVLDIVFLDWNTIGHKPGNWNTTKRPSNLFALNGKDGSVLWHVGVQVYWSNKNFIIADADGDGKQDIITPSSKGGVEGIEVRSLADGKAKGFWPIGMSLSRGAVAGNLYGDGKLYLVQTVMKKSTQPNYRTIDVGFREGSIRIIDTGQRYDVSFSGNFLYTEDQKDAQVQGTIGTPPTPSTPPPATTPPPVTTSPPASTPPTTSTPPATTSPPPATTSPPATTTPEPISSTQPAVTSPSTTTTPPPVGTTPDAVTPPDESTVPGPGAALLVALAGAVAVLAARRRR